MLSAVLISITPPTAALQRADAGGEESLKDAAAALQSLCAAHKTAEIEAAAAALGGSLLPALQELTALCLARGGTSSDEPWVVDVTEALLEVQMRCGPFIVADSMTDCSVEH